jgi:hypothetical protein
MSIDPSALATGVAAGIGATFVMDVWNLFLKWAFRIPSLNYCLLGRWILHISAGRLRHSSIASSAPKTHECKVGWIAHYTIGVTFAIVFLLLTSGNAVSRPSLLSALAFGIATVVFPYFILQPSLGLGVASSRAANPWQARTKSLATHAVFGLGLYLSALAVNYLAQPG